LQLIIPRNGAVTGPLPNRNLPRTHHGLRGMWGRVRWKIIAIIAFTATSTLLIASLSVAVLTVVVRRESANVVEKQVQMLLQASQSVGPAILDHADACVLPAKNSGSLKPLLAYTDEAFPQARTDVVVRSTKGMQPSVPTDSAEVRNPDWLPEGRFAGLVVDRGQIEIRNVMSRENGACKVIVIFSLPLGPELAKRFSSASGMEVTSIPPRLFCRHPPNQRALRTAEANFIPGISRSAAVVLTARNWENGALEDWIVYRVRDSYSRTFEDLARVGSQLANWVWLLAALSIAVLLLDASGVWMCVRFGRDIASTIDALSGAARQIAGGNFAWRAPVRSKGQLGDLIGNFNEMAIALERLHKEEDAKLRIESELQVARSVQEYLYPLAVPSISGASVSGLTVPARTIGGDLYDFFDLGDERVGILCADVSGKGIPAALMMANLQAVARANLGERIECPATTPAHFVEILNRQLAGRFGDNRYATLFWAEYDSRTGLLTYINAGHPSPILVHPNREIERLESNGIPIGMFANTRYFARVLHLLPGSRLVIFSDGLTDAQNASEEEFGDEQLVEFCKELAPGIDAEGVRDRVMQAVAEWSHGAEQFDDTTIVVIDVAPVATDTTTKHHGRLIDTDVTDASERNAQPTK